MKLKFLPLSVIIIECIVSSRIVGAQNPNPGTLMPDCTQPNPELSCICLEIFDPQCGTNNVTYGNDCRLACAQKCDSTIMLAHKGACDTPSTWTWTWTEGAWAYFKEKAGTGNYNYKPAAAVGK